MPSAVPQRGVRIDDELYDKTRVIAYRENRSFNQQLIYVLRKYVHDYEKDNGPISSQEILDIYKKQEEDRKNAQIV